MMGRLSRIGSVLFVALGLVACGSSDRPSEISMDNVPACDLIPQADYQRLQVLAEPYPGPNLTVDEEGSGCMYLLRGGRDRVDVDKVMNQGIDRWPDDSLEQMKAKAAPDVRGFSAINVSSTLDTPGPHANCTLYVDVADGQSLKIVVSENSQDDPPTCDTARRFAEAGMDTLIR